MPAGLQIWDANGVPVLDTSNNIGRFLGSFMGVTYNGSINDPALLTGRPFAIIQIGTSDWAPDLYRFPDGLSYSFSGANFSWAFQSYGSGIRYPANIFYGVY